MSFNTKRHERGYYWLHKAKVAYRNRHYSSMLWYGVAGLLIAPEVALRKRVFGKIRKQLKVNTTTITRQTGDPNMAKQNEIDYIETVAKVDHIDQDTFKSYLLRKPFGDLEVGDYLMDIGQLLKYLPPRPARILDLGVGSGWTSEIMAKCGYEVVGLDISHDMIELAKQKLSPGLNLQFNVLDYEQVIPFGHFDAVVMYDSLHHAVNERAVIAQINAVLKPGGRFVCLEPGKGHVDSPLSIDVMKKYGTTEKDMPFFYIQQLLTEVGFLRIQHYVRLRQLPFVDLVPKEGVYQQIQHFVGLMYETTENGLTSLVVAFK